MRRNMRMLVWMLVVAALGTGQVWGAGSGEESLHVGIDPAASGTVIGRIIDQRGAPVQAGLQLCGTACWPAATEEDGVFRYESVPAESYLLKVVSSPVDAPADATQDCSGYTEVVVEVVANTIVELTDIIVESCPI